MTSARIFHTSDTAASTNFLAALIVLAIPLNNNLLNTKGLNSSKAIFLGNPT